ncbi:YjgN family protein [Luteimonas huabeiensis]|uniref:YjgN family protein n=1 Tax=Luteimonas huabeiensis TaxID=1244513 RepID=UPI000463D7A5|nr:YjgN family protein [Luteimonas huabeiensis]
MLDPQSATPHDGGGDAPVPAPVPDTVRHTPQFDGRAAEFFGIWIVNVLLTVLTLGLYSAWAKVRTERYFYGNTRLAGSAFEYLADPIRILKGRLIAYAVVIAIALSFQFLPLLYFALMLGVFASMPLLVFLSTRFRARYSAWRGLRFRFVGTAGGAYGPFLGWPILSALTLSLGYPLMRKRQHAYLVSGHRFGRTAFGFEARTADYFVPYAIALAMALALFALMATLIGGIAWSVLVAGGETGGGSAAFHWLTVGGLLLFYGGVFVLGVWLRTRYLNLMWNNARLGPHRFESTLRVRDVLWLYAGNLVVVLLTLGLATPWAMVRLARYRASRFAVLVQGGIEDFVADVDAERGAAGAELVDALDLGVDIGL